jgi:hypothetical protein
MVAGSKTRATPLGRPPALGRWENSRRTLIPGCARRTRASASKQYRLCATPAHHSSIAPVPANYVPSSARMSLGLRRDRSATTLVAERRAAGGADRNAGRGALRKSARWRRSEQRAGGFRADRWSASTANRPRPKGQSIVNGCSGVMAAVTVAVIANSRDPHDLGQAPIPRSGHRARDRR